MKAIVSIITVNYNGFIDTCEMIESFHKYETYPYEIIVVDNGSHMPEDEELQKKHPDIVVIKNANTGFAGGNNAGLSLAIDIGGTAVKLGIVDEEGKIIKNGAPMYTDNVKAGWIWACNPVR